MNLATLADIMADARPGFASGKSDDAGVVQVRMNNVSIEGRLNFDVVRRIPSCDTDLGRFAVKPGDILFNATNSPELVGKSALFNGHSEPVVYSNHFLRLRLKRDRADPAYVSHWLRATRSQGTFTGMCKQWVNQASVASERLMAMVLPLPDMSKQRRIAAILDQADALRAKRRAALAQLSEIAGAIFIEMFGDPETNPKGWPCVLLNQVCDLVRGSSPRPQGDPKFFGGPVPRLMIADITRDGMMVQPAIDSLTLEGAKRSRPMPAGSVVMAVSGAVGLPAILKINACIHDGFVGFRNLNSQLKSTFLYYWLAHERVKHCAKGTGAIWVNLTTDQVGQFRMYLPSLFLQDEFIEKLSSIDILKSLSSFSLNKVDLLFASLQHRAFRGEL